MLLSVMMTSSACGKAFFKCENIESSLSTGNAKLWYIYEKFRMVFGWPLKTTEELKRF